MSYEDGSGPISRRPRVNDGPPPVSGVVAIVLAVIAVVAGYLILRSITDDGAVSGGPGIETGDGTGTSTESTVPSTGSTVPQLATTTTTAPGLVTTGASVIVANANGQAGSAGQAARVLENSAGFQLVDPTDANESTPDQDTSSIFYDTTNPAAQTVAESLNTVLGGALNVQPMPDPVPVQDGDLKGAGVLLMLGRDFAEMAPGDLDLASVDQSATPPTNPATSGTTAPTTAPAG